MDLTDRPPNLRDDGVRRAGVTHDKGAESFDALGIGKIGDRSPLFCQALVLGVFHDADDFELPAVFGTASAEALAQRRAVLKEPPRHRLADYRHLLGTVGVLRAEHTTL